MNEVLLKFEDKDKYLEFMELFQGKEVPNYIEVDSENNIININKEKKVDAEQSN